VQETPV